MTDIFGIRASYHAQVRHSFTKQDVCTIPKMIFRAKKIHPRGNVYHRLINLDVNREN